MALDKTLTIRQRRIDIYLPSLEAKARWNAAAKQRGMSLSQFVAQVMELELTKEPEGAVEDKLSREAAFDQLQQQHATLQKRAEQLEKLYERAESDLQEYRAEELLGPSPIKKLDPRVLRVFGDAKDRDGRHRPVDNKELTRSLGIKTETQAKALAKQLEYLELHEVVKRSGKGWVWNG